MRRLGRKQKEEIKKLKFNGYSLRQIKKIMNLPLSTVQYHSPNKKRGKIVEIKKVPPDFIIGELVGAFAGDGNYFYYTENRKRCHCIRYYLSYKDDKEYAQYLFDVLKKMGLNPQLYNLKQYGRFTVREVRVNCKKIYGIC